MVCGETQLRSFLICDHSVKFVGLTATFLHADDDGLLAEIDLGIYSVSALLKVVYKFTDRCYIHLQYRSGRIIEARFRAKDPQKSLESVAGEFCNELLDQRLREIVNRESAPVRNLVLAHALSRTSLASLPLEATVLTPELPPNQSGV